MKLFVIIISLLAERYLIHRFVMNRFSWFPSYVDRLEVFIARLNLPAWGELTLLLLPLLLPTLLILYVFDGFFFGLFSLIINFVVFYYCIGPENPFYPVRPENEHDPMGIAQYFERLNTQLFAVIFWYLILGPIGALIYRLIQLLQCKERIQQIAIYLLNVLDWIPVRMSALLFLLVGHFQGGFNALADLFFSTPRDNQKLLSTCALAAIGQHDQKNISLSMAEELTERAIILLLVLIAVYTLVYFI